MKMGLNARCSLKTNLNHASCSLSAFVVRLAWFTCVAVDRNFWQDEEQDILPDMAHLLFYFAYLLLIVYW